MTEKIGVGVPFYLRALVGGAALLGALAASYLACEQAATAAPRSAAPAGPEAAAWELRDVEAPSQRLSETAAAP